MTMLCLSGFELYSRWVPLKGFNLKLSIAHPRSEMFKLNTLLT